MKNLLFLRNIFLHYYNVLSHKFWVLLYIIKFCVILIYKGIIHDISKFKFDETYFFIKIINNLRNVEYGSKEYKKNLKSIRPAIKKHYERNSHHPEFYESKNGIYKMNIFDFIEMCCDWKAASHQHQGDINKSFEISCERFNLYASIQDLYIKKMLKDIITKI